MYVFSFAECLKLCLFLAKLTCYATNSIVTFSDGKKILFEIWNENILYESGLEMFLGLLSEGEENSLNSGICE